MSRFNLRPTGLAVLLAGAVLLLASGSTAYAQSKSVIPGPAQSPVSAAQRAEMEKIIREYLLANPEIVIEAIQIYREREEKAQQLRAQAALAHSKELLINDPDSPVGGNPKGDVTIVEFFDYRCGYCKRILPTLQEVLNTDKNVRVVFKEFPILGPLSVFASQAALAAHKLDPKKYEAFHNAMMATPGGLSEKRVLRLAKEQGYDPTAIRKEMEAPDIQERIRKNHLLAETLNIRGTPAFVIGNELVPGAVDLDQLRQLIAQARSG